MALIDDITKLFTNMLPVSQGAAQDRYTRTPILQEQPHAPGWNAMYDPRSTPQQAMNQQTDSSRLQSLMSPTMGRTGFPNTPGVIEQQGGADPGTYGQSTLRHEIVHAMTLGDLRGDPKIYRNSKYALPQAVQDDVNQRWGASGKPYDVVEEGVAHFLTEPTYSDPKYNAAKLKLINTFPTTTRGKITRMLGDFSAQ